MIRLTTNKKLEPEIFKNMKNMPENKYFLKVPEGKTFDETIELVADKLGKIEDIEEENGVDLITLFKTLKNGAWFVDNRNNNIFYAKATLVSKIDGKFECPQEDLKFNGFMILDQLYGIGNEIKDYGKTWALTKEELENEL